MSFLVPSLLLLSVAGAVGYFRTRDILDDELGRSLAAVAAAAAGQVSAERLLGIEPDDDRNETRTYKKIHGQLNEVKERSGARRIFAFDPRGRVRIDAGGALPVGAEVPELARDRLEVARVLEGQRAASTLFEGADGQLYKTGYAPLYEEGTVVGAIGVEGSAAFFGPLQKLYRLYLGMAASLLAVLAGLAWGVARSVSRPLDRLVASALRIGQGDLSTPVPPQPTREVGLLAGELEVMRNGLQSRDGQLKMMLAGVAHEVRNPLGGIELFAGLLAEELPPGDSSTAHSHLARIRGEIDYLRRIVDDFLAFALEQKLALVDIDGPSLLGSARELMLPDAEGRGVALTIDASPGAVKGDHNLLLAAMVNLVKNAIQASPSGAAVFLRGRHVSGAYRFEVEDAGAGIPRERAEKVFEPFFTTREKGTGLGLPLARKIAEAHRGSLQVESRTGKTVFSLQLPG